jgi:hypothetical protein
MTGVVGPCVIREKMEWLIAAREQYRDQTELFISFKGFMSLMMMMMMLLMMMMMIIIIIIIIIMCIRAGTAAKFVLHAPPILYATVYVLCANGT